MIIAMDGPAASGKGTLGKRLAHQEGIAYLDTGLLYRAVAYQALKSNIVFDRVFDLTQIASKIDVNNFEASELRGTEVAQGASKVAAHNEVRAALLKLQRAFAAQEGGAVLDGRDIGTVVVPHADVKIYVTASAEARATRRLKDLIAQDEDISYDEVLANIIERDKRDMTRESAPLKAAEDAHLIDTTDLGIEDAFSIVCDIVRKAQAVT